MKRSSLTYLIILFGTAAGLLAAVAAVNATLDPFGMYRFFEYDGVNTYKPAVFNRIRLLKAYEVRRLKPESIILGTSRVHLGMRPSHEGWAGKYRSRYNLAFDGATTKEMYAYLIHANGSDNLKHVMLGLDTYHLTRAPGTTRPDFDPDFLLNDHRWLNFPRGLAADFTLLTSFGMLKESLMTVSAQADPQPSWLAPDGQRHGEVFFHRPSEHFMTCGPRCYFDEIDKQEIRYKLEWKIVPVGGSPAPMPSLRSPDPVTSIEYIQKIIDYCRKSNIRLEIFLTPAHAHQLEIDAATGGWDMIETGKRELVMMLAKEARNHPDREPIPLYDFSTYSSITTESLPPEDSKREMKFYWDSSHFKERVGDMVLDLLLETSQTGRESASDFGRRLTSETIETAIAFTRQRQQEYRLRHVPEINAIAAWVESFRKEHGIVD